MMAVKDFGRPNMLRRKKKAKLTKAAVAIGRTLGRAERTARKAGEEAGEARKRIRKAAKKAGKQADTARKRIRKAAKKAGGVAERVPVTLQLLPTPRGA
jgi:hypothetical protein